MKIQILSDIHLEFSSCNDARTDSDIIVLSGDIGLGDTGIIWARKTWTDAEIIFVPGNHEYYRSSYPVECKSMSRTAQKHGVHLLNPGEVILHGIRFLGATLWTDFGLFGEEDKPLAISRCKYGLADFRAIDGMTPGVQMNLFAKESAWLEMKMKRESFAGKTIVVTHHLPSKLSVAGKYKLDLTSAGFASNLDHLLGFSDLWIHGHTHDNFDYEAYGTRVICNPRGYVTPTGVENRGFLPKMVIQV